MVIKKVIISNYKCYYNSFELELNKGLNIIVGNNEAGKSTIIEAINLALSGTINGRYIKNELTQYIFNNKVVEEYLAALKEGIGIELPKITIEVYIDDYPLFSGTGNSKRVDESGFVFMIAFDEKYRDEYEKLVQIGNINSLPIEYYDVSWCEFARTTITPRTIPIKVALIDSSSNRNSNGSDIYISKIVKQMLEPEEIVEIAQAHRKMREVFMVDDAVAKINEKISTAAQISDKNVKLAVELLSKNAWETSLTTYLDDVPFSNIGMGEQCVVKTKLALAHKKTTESNLLLLEEPENHLGYSKLNKLIGYIKINCQDKQIIVTTHSSFVANKLGLNSLILLNNYQNTKLTDLKKDTYEFFEKISGYDTLRLVLCKKAILVEGDSDELVVQKAYMSLHDGRLPIEDEIDVISVGTSFLRFLEIADRIKQNVSVVSDNDGDYSKIELKYRNYLGTNEKKHIKICIDNIVDTGPCHDINYNTLETKFVKCNGITMMNKILDTRYGELEKLIKHMKNNKTDCALKIFESIDNIKFPEYIIMAVS